MVLKMSIMQKIRSKKERPATAAQKAIADSFVIVKMLIVAIDFLYILFRYWSWFYGLTLHLKNVEKEAN